MKGVSQMKVIKRIISLMIVMAIVLGLQPAPVEASSANLMAAQMINFFKTENQIDDVTTLTPDELRVYGVFLSNFTHPGVFALSDLNTGPDSQLVKDISIKFFSNTDSANLKTIASINSLVYKAILKELQNGDVCTLYASEGATKAINGKELLNKMSSNTKDINTKVYISESNKKKVCLDLSQPAVQGAFKILASYSIDFMLGKKGVANMSALYIDGLGNIWGAYQENVGGGENKVIGETQKEQLKLVMPACLNPLAFTSFANASIDVKPTQADLRLPLTNSYAMGALINTKAMDSNYTKNVVPYYNIYHYLRGKDINNMLNIYGISSPSTAIFNSNSALDTNIGLDSKLPKFFNDKFTTIQQNSTYIVLTNNMGVVQKSLEDLVQDLKGINEKTDILSYLYGTLDIPLTAADSNTLEGKYIADKMYYFGDSDAGGVAWDSQFSDIGMLGASLFLDTKNTFYGSNTINNRITTALSELYNSQTAFEKPLTLSVIEKNKELYYPAKKDMESTWGNGLMSVQDSCLTDIATAWRFLFLSWGDTYYVYSLGSKDTKVISYFTDYNEYGGYTLSPKIDKNVAYAQLYHTFNTYTLFSSYPITVDSTVKNSKVESYDKKIAFTTNNYLADGTNNWPGIFFGYLVDILQMDKATKKTTDGETKFDCYSFKSEFLPPFNPSVTGGKLDLTAVNAESGVSNDEEKTMEETQKDLIKKIYGIVSDGNNDYRNRWIKSTVDGFLLTIHRSITGSWFSNMSTVSAGSGSTYQGVTGYIHTPSLDDLPFTSWTMQHYMQIYALLLLIITMFLIIMVLLKMRTVRQGVAIFLFMCIALLIPNILIGNTINISNKLTDSIYSDRFDFWAMTQHQQSLIRLKGIEKGSKAEIIASAMEKTKDMYSGDAGVRVKWMSPKKNSAFNNFYTDEKLSESLETNLTIFKWLFSSFVYESEFVGNDSLATYLYRPYNSIVKAASEYYELGKDSILLTDAQGVASETGSNEIETIKIPLIDKNGKKINSQVVTYKLVKDVYEKAKKSERSKDYEKMFYAALIHTPEFYRRDNFTQIYYSEDKVNDIKTVDTYAKLNENSVDSLALWGMGSVDVNNVMFQKAEKIDNVPNAGIDSHLPDEGPMPTETSMEEAHKDAFLMNTESPYYYFYSTLKNRYSSGSGKFKTALLDKDVFKVNDTKLNSTSMSANGKVRDFLDLEGLFTYMIPYLSVCNDYVYDWTKLNGTSVPTYGFKGDDVENKSDNINHSEYLKDQKLKNQMQQVWNMYSPWVDQLNSLDIYNKRVKVGTKTLRIENTLNPSYYLIEGRPMIFSEADMIAKGYRVSDLTDVERRIQKVLDDTYTDLMYLVNYYDMDDQVLLGAAAMYATFNFNREFSQTNLLGQSVMLYPQSFEMKNFNHDAFMRLALLNSTGETVFGDTDLYERVMSKTSLFTGILLLLEDVVAVILIPTLKLILLLMLLFLGLLICVSCILNPPEKIVETVTKSLMLPTLLFMLATIVFAFVVSLVIGDGLTAYVGSQNISIVTNDPTITILLLVVMGFIYILALVKIIKIMFDTYKKYAPASVVAAVGLAKDLIGKSFNKTKQIVKGAVTGAATSSIAGGPLMALPGLIGGAVDGATGGKLKDLAMPYITGKANAKAFGGSARKDIRENIDQKASSPELYKQRYQLGGTKLGNKLEDLVYTKNKFKDNLNNTSHTIKRTGHAISDFASGDYLKRSVEQARQADQAYTKQRDTLDKARKTAYMPKSTEDAINKMRKPRG